MHPTVWHHKCLSTVPQGHFIFLDRIIEVLVITSLILLVLSLVKDEGQL